MYPIIFSVVYNYQLFQITASGFQVMKCLLYFCGPVQLHLSLRLLFGLMESKL